MTNRWFGSLGFLSTEELLLSGRWGVGLPGGGGGYRPWHSFPGPPRNSESKSESKRKLDNR